jgi:hypothetical protein
LKLMSIISGNKIHSLFFIKIQKRYDKLYYFYQKIVSSFFTTCPAQAGVCRCAKFGVITLKNNCLTKLLNTFRNFVNTLCVMRHPMSDRTNIETTENETNNYSHIDTRTVFL